MLAEEDEKRVCPEEKVRKEQNRSNGREVMGFMGVRVESSVWGYVAGGGLAALINRKPWQARLVPPCSGAHPVQRQDYLITLTLR